MNENNFSKNQFGKTARFNIFIYDDVTMCIIMTK